MVPKVYIVVKWSQVAGADEHRRARRLQWFPLETYKQAKKHLLKCLTSSFQSGLLALGFTYIFAYLFIGPEKKSQNRTGFSSFCYYKMQFYFFFMFHSSKELSSIFSRCPYGALVYFLRIPSRGNGESWFKWRHGDLVFLLVAALPSFSCPQGGLALRTIMLNMQGSFDCSMF